LVSPDHLPLPLPAVRPAGNVASAAALAFGVQFDPLIAARKSRTFFASAALTSVPSVIDTEASVPAGTCSK